MEVGRCGFKSVDEARDWAETNLDAGRKYQIRIPDGRWSPHGYGVIWDDENELKDSPPHTKLLHSGIANGPG